MNSAGEADDAVSAAVRNLIDVVFGDAPVPHEPFRCADPRVDSGCCCRECLALRHLAKATCHVKGCGKSTKYHLTRWYPTGPWELPAEPGDPHADADGLVTLPRDPRSGEHEDYYVCGTIHARDVLDAHPDFDTKAFGRIVFTWGLVDYEWHPIEETVPSTYSTVFEALRREVLRHVRTDRTGTSEARARHELSPQACSSSAIDGVIRKRATRN